MKPGFFTASCSNAAHDTMGFLSFLSAPLRAPTVEACWPAGTAPVASSAVCLILISSVMFLSPFLPPLLAGHKKASGRLLARPRADFLGGAGTEEPKRAGRRKPKQKPAEPSARRRVCQLAMPAKAVQKRRRLIEEGQADGANELVTRASNLGVTLSHQY
jgi:hypothetical protein